jgi:hypothetical protein
MRVRWEFPVLPLRILVVSKLGALSGERTAPCGNAALFLMVPTAASRLGKTPERNKQLVINAAQALD